MVAPRKRRSFFPEIYNEEWLYILDDASVPALALTGSVVQDAYDPFGDPKRAAQEEFGEVIALGLHSCIREGLRLSDTDREFWRRFLSTRCHFLDFLLEKYEGETEGVESDKIISAIRLARDTFTLITPAFCVAYVDAWLRDRRWWASYLEKITSNMPIKDAVTELGLAAFVIS